ncbi:tail fiber assembly protein [Enterobacter cloacae subsp. cloacae]|nr:tail fiber assembly protein [Enterobacter cloacae subsp. cloacae]
MKAINEERKSQLLREIAEEIAPLQDAVELGISTKDEEDSLLEWRRYRAG